MKSNNGNNNNPAFCLEVWGTDYKSVIKDFNARLLESFLFPSQAT
jgi:hypothetical protein